MARDSWLVRGSRGHRSPKHGRADADAGEDSAEAAMVRATLPEPDGSRGGAGSADTTGEAAPRVLVLGRVEVVGAHDDVVPHRRPRGTELVAYLALHPGASHHEVDEVLWPGQRVSKETRNPFVSQVRTWLGTRPDKQPYLPYVADEGDYRLHPDVGCDWHDFCRLARHGLSRGADGADDLATALALVRGRPFLGVDPDTYTWAEPDTQEMVSAIVDVAHALSTIRLDQGDYRAAQDAAAQGLLTEPCSELLYRDAIRGAAARGDTDEARRLAGRLREQIEQLDPTPGPEEDTVELLQQLHAPAR
jgi:DNA-binding SARP family transcriptional activator